MIRRLYNPWTITNAGEKEADKQLSSSCGDETMHVIHSLRLSSRYHPTQMSGECDFVVVTRLGLMIIEVKGGIIGYGKQPDGDTGFYRLVRDRSREKVDDPFSQAADNAEAVQKYLLEKNARNIFTGSMVCFPECDFSSDNISDDFIWHRGQPLKLAEMILDSLEIQIEKFRENERRKGVTRHISWRELDDEEIKGICDLLEPEFNPAWYRELHRMNIDEADRRMREGLAVLSGLNGNRRIMVQGPPGSGKSTFAFDLIRRLSAGEGMKGLYICWNELLCAEMKARLSDPANDLPSGKISAKLYFDLAVELAKLSGDKSLVPTKDTVKKGEMRNRLKGAVSGLGSSNKAERYDYIVVDEAQDLFDKGVDIVLKALLKGNNPLQNGNWYIFYDDSQDYPDAGDLSTYVRTRDALKSYSAFYTLQPNLRVNTGNGLRELITDAQMYNVKEDKDYGEDVMVRRWSSSSDALNEVRQAFRKETLAGGIPPGKVLVLFSADLLKEGSELSEILKQAVDMELLAADNYMTASTKARYTSILKAKGLERDVVILLMSSLAERKDQFQVFIGASRAKSKGWVLLKRK